MKILFSAVMLLSLTSYAQTPSRPKNEGAVETMVKKAKKERKKKVEMCHECGKPEEQCDCKGEEHRKGE